METLSLSFSLMFFLPRRWKMLKDYMNIFQKSSKQTSDYTKQNHDTYIQPISSIFPCPNSTEVSSMNLSRALLTLKGSSSQTPPPWRYHVTYIKTSNLHVELKEYATYGMWRMRDHPCRTCPRERQRDDLNTAPVLTPVSLPLCTPTALLFLNTVTSEHPVGQR